MFKVIVNNTESASIIYAGQSVLIEVTGAPKTGAKGMTWRGTYNALTDYLKDDAVSYLGSSYIAKSSTTGNDPTNATYWDLLAEKGDPGEGGGASSNITTVEAGTAISSGRIVTITDGVANYAQVEDLDNEPTGIAVTAASLGDNVNIVTFGIATIIGWGLTPGATYYLTGAGVLSTSPSGTGKYQAIGTALSSTQLKVNIQQAITL